MRGVVTGDKGLDRDGQPTGQYEPGSEVHARATVLAEGTQGHLTGALIEHYGLRTGNPQIYSLGVKELWRVARPLDRVIHTLGWPLRAAAKHGESGGSFIYPMGEERVALGFVIGLEQVGHPPQVRLVGEHVDTHARRSGPRGFAAARHRDDAYLVPVEQVDRRRVEPGRIEGDHRGVGLAGAAGREQLVDVDAALEHDHPGPRVDQLEHG